MTKGKQIIADDTKCAGCRICQLRCSLRFEKAFSPAKAHIKIMRLVEADSEYAVAFSEDCDYCGICAIYCPYGCLRRMNREET